MLRNWSGHYERCRRKVFQTWGGVEYCFLLGLFQLNIASAVKSDFFFSSAYVLLSPSSGDRLEWQALGSTCYYPDRGVAHAPLTAQPPALL